MVPESDGDLPEAPLEELPEEEEAGPSEDAPAPRDTAPQEDGGPAPDSPELAEDRPSPDAVVGDAGAPADSARPDVPTADTSPPRDAPMVPMVPPGCAGSASGASASWACTGDRRSRQRCVSAMTETVGCEFGCTPGSPDAVCSCGPHTGFTVWNCMPGGNLGRCDRGAWITRSCEGRGCAVRPTGVDDVCNDPPPPEGALSCAQLQWWNSALTYQHMSSGWVDTDLAVRTGTQVQLRHASRLERTGVYGWGYMPEFTDLVTTRRFRFLHLRPSTQNATTVGRTYPAGFIVGLSGGETRDTGYPTYSTGAHLCVQTLVSYRTAFPTGRDACR